MLLNYRNQLFFSFWGRKTQYWTATAQASYENRLDTSGLALRRKGISCKGGCVNIIEFVFVKVLVVFSCV